MLEDRHCRCACSIWLSQLPRTRATTLDAQWQSPFRSTSLDPSTHTELLVLHARKWSVPHLSVHAWLEWIRLPTSNGSCPFHSRAILMILQFIRHEYVQPPRRINHRPGCLLVFVPEAFEDGPVGGPRQSKQALDYSILSSRRIASVVSVGSLALGRSRSRAHDGLLLLQHKLSPAT